MPENAIAPKDSASSAGADMTPAAAVSEAFLEVLSPVLISSDETFQFPGSIVREHAEKFWHWIARDVVPDATARVNAKLVSASKPAKAFEGLLPEIQEKLKAELAAASSDREKDRRITVQLGGDDVRADLPKIRLALKARNLMDKASAFGRAANGIQDEAAIGAALKSMPLKERALVALLFQALVGQVSTPSRLITGVLPLCGGGREDAIKHAGFDMLVEAILAHAYDQMSHFEAQYGQFADIDLVCRAVDRMHRLMRAVTGYVELERGSRWSRIAADITTKATARLEPRLREISADVSQSLRKARDGADRVDSERLLAALNGMYLLCAVRDARDSLAVNALFDKLWTETGQALEVLLTRNLEEYRNNPNNEIVGERLDYGIKMAELRYNQEYADILRKARAAAERAR